MYPLPAPPRTRQEVGNQPGQHQHRPWRKQSRASQLRLRTGIGNALNLHRHALWQLLDGDTAPRGLVRKVLFEDAVHLGKVGHVVEEDVDLW